jgi:peptide/nickel transport system substrate-binding protein
LAQKTLRMIGASVILAGVVVAGITQMTASGNTGPAEIALDVTTTSTSDDALPTTTEAADPFHYRIGLLSGVTTHNFWAFYGEQPSVWNAYVLGPTKPALFTVSSTAGSLAPELAKAMAEPVFDETGWRVRVDLRSDFAWSDGTPITAHDVVFTFETVRELELGGSWADAFPTAIESMHAESEDHLRIEFNTRPELTVWPYGIGVAPIMPEHIWGDLVGHDVATLYEDSADRDVFGGPLALEAVSAAEIRAVVNPGYPIGGVPDTVTYTILSDEQAAMIALAGDEIDIVVSPGGLATIDDLESSEAVDTVSSPANDIRYLGFNLQREPMAQPAFRQALGLLLDKKEIAARVGAGTPAWSMIPRANEVWYDAEAAAAIEESFAGSATERLRAALDGLRGAGYSWSKEPAIDDGGELVPGTGLTIDGATPQTLTILTPGDAYDPVRLRYVDELTAVVAAIGFDVRAVPTDFDTVVDLVFTPDEEGGHRYDMYVLGWTLGDPALPRHYEALFGEGGPLNNTGYVSDRFAAALASYEGAFSQTAARDALWEMESILAADLPYLPLYTSEIVEAYRSDRVELVNGGQLGGWQARLGGIRDVTPAR